MASAVVGDDVFGEDPTVADLERRVAALMGREYGLFVPSGTMGNQIALQLHARHGDEVLVADGAHCLWYESGAAAAIAGVQLVAVGTGGLVTPDELRAALRPRVDWCPKTSALVLENTHNRAGGKIIDLAVSRAVITTAHAAGLAVHLDGARLLNASVALGLTPAEVAGEADTVSVCLSKGLGAPAGSVLVGSREQMYEARRLRKRMGGGMRQVGVLAAAGIFALDHHLERLADDHHAARALAAGLDGCPGITAVAPDTNIVMIDVAPGAGVDAHGFADHARVHGVLLSVFGEFRLRAVTHLEVSLDDALTAAEVIRKVSRAVAA
ncbi:MAG: GntG family PLP-dependent aldolase [Deltaproteobacteria bacterium]|nr:GntG family PLP-dependent aldolase [Deltaproteobacteria bacterium]